MVRLPSLRRTRKGSYLMPSSNSDPARMPNAELRDAVLRAHRLGEISYAGLATAIGLTKMRKQSNRPNAYIAGDSTFLLRMLGVRAYKEKNGKRYHNKTMQVKYAEKIMLVLGLDPIDVGL